MRSGSPTHGSIPSASSAAARSGRRVVPRTAWPSASSDRASATPRHPQPTTRTRANLAGVGPRPTTLTARVGLRPTTLTLERGPELFLGDLGLSLGPPAVVLDRQQLVDLLALEPGFAPGVERALLGGDVGAQLALGQLRAAAAPAALVGRLEHLIDVVELVLDLRFQRGVLGLPVEHVGTGAKIEATQQEHEDDDDRHPAEDDHDEGVHDRGRVYP